MDKRSASFIHGPETQGSEAIFTRRAWSKGMRVGRRGARPRGFTGPAPSLTTAC